MVVTNQLEFASLNATIFFKRIFIINKNNDRTNM